VQQLAAAWELMVSIPYLAALPQLAAAMVVLMPLHLTKMVLMVVLEAVAQVLAVQVMARVELEFRVKDSTEATAQTHHQTLVQVVVAVREV
jgi:uncharacterized membrane protein